MGGRTILKFIHSKKATKILRNLPLTFDYSTYGQKLGEDFAKLQNFVAFSEYMNFKKEKRKESFKHDEVTKISI